VLAVLIQGELPLAIFSAPCNQLVRNDGGPIRHTYHYIPSSEPRSSNCLTSLPSITLERKVQRKPEHITCI
jgi:hypothetical protein